MVQVGISAVPLGFPHVADMHTSPATSLPEAIIRLKEMLTADEYSRGCITKYSAKKADETGLIQTGF